MNRLFGKNTKKQQLTQHSLLDDNDDDDAFTQVEAAHMEYRPPPASLFPAPSSPNQQMRGGVGRHHSSQYAGPASPSQQQPPRSPVVATKMASIPRSPRRFSSPDRLPKFLSVTTTATNVNNTKVSMLRGLRDRMKLGSLAAGAQTSDSKGQPSNQTSVATDSTSKNYSEPPSSMFSSAEFSEPFTTENVIKSNPASEAFTEAFTVTQTTLSEDVDVMNDTGEDPAAQVPRTKLKFSISSEPILPKVDGTPIKVLNCRDIESKEDKSEEVEGDPKESIGKQRVTKVIRLSRKKTADKRPKTPTKQATVDIAVITKTPTKCVANETPIKQATADTAATPKTPTKGVADETELEADELVDDSNTIKEKSLANVPGKSNLKTAKAILPSTKDTAAIKPSSGVVNKISIDNDEVDETIVRPSFHLKSKSPVRDHAPQTPKRSYSSDDEAQFFVDTTGDNDSDKIIAAKNSRPSSSKAPTPLANDIDAAVVTSEVKSNVSKKNSSKSPKTPTKDKKKKSASTADKIATSKSPSRKEASSSSSKLKEKDQSKASSSKEKRSTTVTNKKKSSTSKKQKRRNSTNTIMSSDENDQNNSSIPLIGNKWLDIIDTNEPTSNTKLDTVTGSKRRNSWCSVASSITMEAALKPPLLASAVTVPDAFTNVLDDDVPSWVKAAMQMIEEYQKNKDFVPPIDPLTMLSMSSHPIPPGTHPVSGQSSTTKAGHDTSVFETPTQMVVKSSHQHAPKAPIRAASISSSDSESSLDSCSTSSRNANKVETKAVDGSTLPGEKAGGPKLQDKLSENGPQETVTTNVEVDQLATPLEVTASVPSYSTKNPIIERSKSFDDELMERMGRSVDFSHLGTTKKPTTRSKSIDNELLEELGKSIDFSNLVTRRKPATRSKSIDNELMEELGKSVDFSRRTKTPLRGIVPAEKPKISLHSSSLYNRDNTPARVKRSNSGINEKDVVAETSVSDKDRFRELRRIAKKAANESVSSDDDEHQAQTTTRRGGTKKSLYRGDMALQTSLTKETVPEDRLGKSPTIETSQALTGQTKASHDLIAETKISNDLIAENSSHGRREQRGSIQFRKLRRLAKLAANEPLSDDDESITAGDNVEKTSDDVNNITKDNVHCSGSGTEHAAAPPVTPERAKIPRSKSKTLENIPSLQQRKEMFEK